MLASQHRKFAEENLTRANNRYKAIIAREQREGKDETESETVLLSCSLMALTHALLAAAQTTEGSEGLNG